MRDIKLAFDPAGLLNPGKVLPDDLPDPVHAAALPVTGKVAAPGSAEEAAAILAGCRATGRRVRIASSLERFDQSLDNADLLLSTHALRGIHAFAPDDLYVTVGAGTPLAAVAAFLAEHGLQAPLAAPWPDATVGGLLATNCNAPLRMRYGGWRDNVLAVKAALADGRVIRAGRPVVKNVAGYDLARLFVGSQGALGVMAEITLKLTPRPRLRQTLHVAVNDLQQGIQWAQATAPCWLMAAGVVVQRDESGQHQLAITLEGLPEDVRAEAGEITAALGKAGAPAVTTVDEPTATALWCDHLAAAGNDMLRLRIGVPPQHLALYWQMLPEKLRGDGAWLVDIASGLLYARWRVEGNEQARRWVAQVREPALALRGYAVVEDLPAALMGAIDRWGYGAEGEEIGRAIQRRWDPAGILIA
jgi:D-lactate dehydrogenase (cytochrome)